MLNNLRRKIAFWVYPEAEKHIVSLDHQYSMAVDVLREVGGILGKKEAQAITDVARATVEKLNEERMRTEAIDARNLMRQQLGLEHVDVEIIDNIEHGLPEAKRRQFHLWGYQLANTEWWKHVRAFSINKQAARTLKEMLVDERHAWIGGGRIDGIMYLDELVEALRAAHESDIAPEEPFNKDNLIQE